MVSVDFERLPAVVDPEAAMEPVHAVCPRGGWQQHRLQISFRH